jgi:hypothetical protein
MKLVLRLAAALCALAAGSAGAAELKIVDVKAFLYLEHAGKFSGDIVNAPAFDNLAKGGGPGGEVATAILFDLTFQGDKNAAPKYATATVDVIQTNHSGQQIVTHKAFTNFQFGADGLQHKTFLVENATCMPIAVDIRAAKTAKNAKLDFQCN